MKENLSTMPCRKTSFCLLVLVLLSLPTGCSLLSTSEDESDLDTVAALNSIQITGVALSGDGRIFVNSPFWQDDHVVSVMEMTGEDRYVPYPNRTWNQWTDGLAPAEHFICVQSVYVDPRNPETLWVLDPASPLQQGVVPGGAKLVEIDLTTDQVVRTILFDETVAPTDSYLNDVRVDADQQWAYLTDSGLGALVVVDLGTGQARRLLAAHPSTQADADYVLEINGEPLRGPSGQVPQIHADGIALSPDDAMLYYHVLTGRDLYRIPTAALRDAALSEAEVADQVEYVAETVVTDGMIMDAEGNLYHTALEHNAVMRYTPSGEIETVLQSDALQWPDTFAWGSDGQLYVTTSLIHQMPQYNGGESTRTEPYRVFRIDFLN